jgi:hypothetical protein
MHVSILSALIFLFQLGSSGTQGLKHEYGIMYRDPDFPLTGGMPLEEAERILDPVRSSRLFVTPKHYARVYLSKKERQDRVHVVYYLPDEARHWHVVGHFYRWLSRDDILEPIKPPPHDPTKLLRKDMLLEEAKKKLELWAMCGQYTSPRIDIYVSARYPNMLFQIDDNNDYSFDPTFKARVTNWRILKMEKGYGPMRPLGPQDVWTKDFTEGGLGHGTPPDK